MFTVMNNVYNIRNVGYVLYCKGVTMSYVSPPESRSRVENIKKRFEVINNDLSLSARVPVNRSSLGNKTQPSNGTKSSASGRRKILHTAISNPIDIPRKFPNPSPTIKTPTGGPMRAERQLSNPYGRGHIRRSPAFRCDKIVKGRNVVGQTSGAPEKTRSVVGNRVKLFEDGQSVKSVVRKLNVSPYASSDMAAVANKSHRLQLRKQLPCEETDAAKKLMSIINSGNTVSTTYATESRVNNPSISKNFGGKAILSNEIDLENSETVPQHSTKLAKPGAEYASVSKVKAEVLAPFLHKFDSRGVKLPLQNQQSGSDCTVENSTTVRNMGHKEVGSHAKLTSVPSGNKVNNIKGTSCARSEQDQVPPETLQEEASTNYSILTDTLKAALKAPLPAGPPPKKPPRTFAHNTPHPDNVGQHSLSMPSATTSAIEAVSNKDLPQQENFFKIASEEMNVQKAVKPVRSRTESEIMLKKLESVLVNHQQGTGGVVLRPKSPLMKRHVEDKATVTYSEPHSDSGKSVGRMGPLPSLPLKSEPLSSQETYTDGDSARSGGCLNLTCVSVSSNNPLRSQIHLYEKVLEKQSEFFVESPKNHSPSKSIPKPYGALLHSKSRSEEHIYAEPFDYLKKIHNCTHGLQDRKSPWNVLKGGESVGDLSKIGTHAKEFQNQTSTSLSSKSVTSRSATLHYLCTPLRSSGTAGIAENGIKTGNNESKKTEPIIPTIPERQVSNAPQSLGTETGTSEQKKPPLLRLAALVRGGQTTGFINVVPSKVERMKIQLLMNQAFGSPLQGMPISPLDLVGSDSDSQASTPDDGTLARVIQKVEAESAGTHSPDGAKVGMTAARCVESNTQGEDNISTSSAEQQEQLTRQAEERKVYVRRVSSRVYHRVRSTATTPSAFPHLFQCILLVGLNLDPSDKKTKVPYIKSKYPLDADVPPHIEHFCFPDARDWPPPPPPPPPATPSQPGCGGNDEQSYSLVITSETGVRRFGYCRRVQPEGSSLCLPLAYCIISPFRASGFYYKILAELESRHGQPEWLQTAFIKELYNCQFPGPGQGLKLSTSNTTHNIAGPVCSMVTTFVRRPLDSRLEEHDLTQLFSALPVSALLQLFGSLLLERRVILISNSLSRLSSCVEALQSILYPFSWQHTLIPVLPTSLLDICSSPTPYIVGILRGRDASMMPGPVDERESFIKAVTSESIRLFLEWFTETAMFSAFIESRLESESDTRGMFDQRCLEHSEEMENNTRLFLRNYKALNKKVKTFGDRLKDWTPFS
ncbi:uncharacterized protein LOC111867790 isoform X2 [Cryptotermes secundus]|uniref:uncharacterized protein LOC111867790 isoform X2 n=1 Tax=Cryptotermes secundus TaxID=105785 RepID=UPI000CD7AF5B|nr:uncharacterized protein LOC111867790 isoform X2 [Cryptotermes secundus]